MIQFYHNTSEYHKLFHNVMAKNGLDLHMHMQNSYNQISNISQTESQNSVFLISFCSFYAHSIEARC